MPQNILKVLFIVTAYPCSDQDMPGIFHKTLAEALLQHGLKIEVVAPVPFVPPGFQHLSRRWNSYRNVPESYELNQVKVLRPKYFQIPSGNYYGVPHVQIVNKIRNCISNKPNLIHAHYAYPPGLSGVELSRRWGIPLVLSLHGSDVNYHPYKSRIARSRFVKAVNEADRVTTVSHALRTRTLDLSGREPEFVPIGISLDRFSIEEEKAELRNRYGLPLGCPLVLFVGGFNAQKGLNPLMQALEELKELHVKGVFIGDGPLVKDLRMLSNAIIVGPKDNAIVAKYMKACDAFILPSKSEGMPTVLVEAGASGLPIIAAAVGGIPELLDGDRGVLLQNCTGSGIAQAVRDILRYPSEASQRSRRMLTYVREQYDAKRNALRFISIYQDLCSGT